MTERSDFETNKDKKKSSDVLQHWSPSPVIRESARPSGNVEMPRQGPQTGGSGSGKRKK